MIQLINVLGRNANLCEEVHNESKNTILFKAYIITLAVPKILKSTLGRKTILIYPMFLICILLGSSVESFVKNTLTFEELQKLIKSHQICEILYNPSKSAALVNIDCGSAYYINFITKQTHRIVDQWPSVFFSWRNDKIAEVVSSCGNRMYTSCDFIAPSTVIACNSHDFRVKGIGRRMNQT